MSLIDTDRHGIDGEVAPRYVVGKSAVFDNGIAGVAGVALTAGPDKFKLKIATVDLCRAVGAEHRHRGIAPHV